MNVVCRGNGFDFATDSTKGTKDCGNGFFFAVFVFFVAKRPFDRHFVGFDSAGAVAGDGFDPQNTPKTQKWGNRSAPWSACSAWPAVKGLLASVLQSRLSPVGYRSVTLGNGDVLKEVRLFSTFSSIVREISGRERPVVAAAGKVDFRKIKSN